MKKIGFILLICAVLTLSGCMDLGEPEPTALPPMERAAVQSREELYEIYDKIDFNMTAAELEAEIGPAVHSETSINESSTGVSLKWERNGIETTAALENNLIVAKSIYVSDPRVIYTLDEGIDMEKAHTIEVGATYSDIVDIMGYEGIEIMRSIDRSATPITQRYLMEWVGETGTVMSIYFNQDGTIVESDTENGYYTSRLFEFPTIEPGATYAPTDTPDPDATPRPTAILTNAPDALTTDAPAQTEEPSPVEGTDETAEETEDGENTAGAEE